MNSRKLIKFIKSKMTHEDRVLDIGCGNKRGHEQLNCFEIVTVDGWDKFNPTYLLDLEVDNLPFEEPEFEVVLMIDFIEHLRSHERGFELIAQAKQACKGWLILMTPVIWDENSRPSEDPKSPYYGNPFNYHHTLWRPYQLSGIGFNQVGGVMNSKYYLGEWRNDQ